MKALLPTKTKKKDITFALKIVVTASLCSFIIVKGHWSSILQQMRALSPWSVAMVFGLLLLAPIISSLKWSTLLILHGIKFPFHRLVRFYYIAMFFNNFLPTRIGGDIYRMMNNGKSRSGAVISIGMERITGTVALLTLGLTGGIVGFVQYGHDVSKQGIIIGLFGLCIIVFSFCFISHKTVCKWFIKTKWIPRKIVNLFEQMDKLAKSKL